MRLCDPPSVRFVLLVSLAFAGCYHPTAPEGTPCSLDGQCPRGLDCFDGRCLSEAPPEVDAMVDVDAPADAALTGCIAEVASSKDVTCARTLAGSVWCWGENQFGEAGDGMNQRHLSPVKVGIPSAKQLTLSPRYGCALDATDTIWCWGDNTESQLGDGTTGGGLKTPVQALTAGAKQIAIGTFTTCAVMPTGTVSCWGRGTDYNRGDNTTARSATATTVMGLTGAVEVELGSYSGCARTTANQVWCWGLNDFGQLADATLATGMIAKPTMYPSAIALTMSGTHTDPPSSMHSCVLTSTGTVLCAGANQNGQLGDGTTTQRMAPVTAAIDTVTAVDAGTWHTCAARVDGSVWCWGRNHRGQLGRGTQTNNELVPAPVPGISVLGIGLGRNHSCALLSDRTVACWGENSNGELGDGTTIQRLAPTVVPIPCL